VFFQELDQRIADKSNDVLGAPQVPPKKKRSPPIFPATASSFGRQETQDALLCS